MKRAEITNAATLIRMLRELGLSYQETVDLLSNTPDEIKTAKNLWKKEEGKSASPLIKLGATMFFVPVPIVSEVLGIILMSAGLFQSKFKEPPLLINDIYETCRQITKELSELKL